jgi:hypothetical protein
MTATAAVRLAVTEYQPAPSLVHDLAEQAGLAAAEVERQLLTTARRLGTAVAAGETPIQLTDQGVNVAGIAGLVRLSPSIELEVAPKFLGATDPTWREDLLTMASLVRGGRILPRDRIRASHRGPVDLATVLGQAVVDLYQENARRPLRTYRREEWEDMVLDGDVDPETLFIPTPSGFRQERIVFDRGNIYNHTIRQAVGALLGEIRDPGLRAQLTRIDQTLTTAWRPRAGRHPVRVPSRHRRWQALYDLAGHILGGTGISLEPGGVPAPGFVLNTWQAWEDLLTLSLEVALPVAVHSQHHYRLGDRSTPGKARTPVEVIPDVAVGEPPSFLADAKYKTRLDRPTAITETDLYEALAFAAAAEVGVVVLIYPQAATSGVSPAACGTTQVFEEIRVGSRRIVGVHVELRGLARAGGLHQFAERLADGVLATTGA